MEPIILVSFGILCGGAVWLFQQTRQFQKALKDEQEKTRKLLEDFAGVITTTSKSQAAIATEVERLKADLAGFRIERARR
jgi:hypothetical protein